MKITPYIPDVPQLSREVITVILATIAAAWFFSQAPDLQKWVSDRLPKSLPPGA